MSNDTLRKLAYKELEALVLALDPAEALQLMGAVMSKLNKLTDNARSEVRDSILAYTIDGGSHAMEAQVRMLLERLAHLPPERQAEARDFIEFLHQREAVKTTANDFTQASETAFAKVWENDDDALYDKL